MAACGCGAVVEADGAQRDAARRAPELREVPQHRVVGWSGLGLGLGYNSARSRSTASSAAVRVGGGMREGREKVRGCEGAIQTSAEGAEGAGGAAGAEGAAERSTPAALTCPAQLGSRPKAAGASPCASHAP